MRQTYRDEHEDRELEDANVYRYDINVEGVKGSVTQLTMVLATRRSHTHWDVHDEKYPAQRKSSTMRH